MEPKQRRNDTPAPCVKFFWVSDQIVCSMDIIAENLDINEIGNALGAAFVARGSTR